MLIKTKEKYKIIREVVFHGEKPFCLRCGNKEISTYKHDKDGKNYYYCPICNKTGRNRTFNDLTFTPFYRSKYSFKAICLIAFFFLQNQNHSQIFRSMKELGYKVSVNGVWRTCLKFRKFIFNYLNSEKYYNQFKNDLFEIDEMYIPCSRMYEKKKKQLIQEGIKRGVYSEMNVCIQTYISKTKKRSFKMTRSELKEKEKNREIYFRILETTSNKEMDRNFYDIPARQRINTIHTDDFRYTFHRIYGIKRHSVKHKAGEYARGFVHTNTAESIHSLVKANIRKHRCVSKKNLVFYLAETVWKIYNNKTTNDLFYLLN